MIKILMLSKASWTPCIAAKHLLDKITTSYGLSYDVKLIDRDPELRPKYGLKVPVTIINDEVICEMYTEESKIRQHIESILEDK